MSNTDVLGQSSAKMRKRRSRKPASSAPPLCVDLDGTLIRSDVLAESVLALLRRNLLYIFLLPVWLMRGKARLKAEISRRVTLDAANLPYHQELIAYLRAEKARGRRIYLATASHEIPARAIARHLRLFDGVFASSDTVNLKGPRKLARIETELGAGNFHYAANGRVDLPLFEAAQGAMLVAPETGVKRRMCRAGIVPVAEFDGPARSFRSYVKALRLHQWLKNTLIFLPLLLAHKVSDLAALQQSALAFLAFGLCASSVYLLNDLLDLADDRRHPEKRQRPFAAGLMPVSHGLVLGGVLLAASAAIAALLPWQFSAVLASYYAMTLAYSFFFKRTLLFDVIVLAALYTSRIVAGSAALAIERSPWLLAFSVFLFFSLALVKRYVELGQARDTQTSLSERARGYRSADRETLSQFGVASGLISVLVLALYIDSDTVRELYGHPEIIWFLCPLMLYLITRIWVLARRGELPGDPVLFAARDWRSQCIVGLGALLLLAATL